jgi:hypothetical protein
MSAEETNLATTGEEQDPAGTTEQQINTVSETPSEVALVDAPTETAEELLSTELPGTTPEEIAAGEAPAQEANTVEVLPVETLEVEAPVSTFVAPTPEAQASETEQPQTPLEPGKSGLDGEEGNSGPLAGYVVAHDETLTPETTANQTIVQQPFELPVQQHPVAYTFEDQIADISKSSNVYQQAIITAVDMYISVMRPRMPTTIKDGTRGQLDLWQAIYSTIHRNNTDFNGCWSLWLSYFNHYKDSVFGVRYAFRFFEFMQLPRDQRIAFQRILNLMILTANLATRAQNLKHVDLEATLSVYFNEEDRMKLLNYYLG